MSSVYGCSVITDTCVRSSSEFPFGTSCWRQLLVCRHHILVSHFRGHQKHVPERTDQRCDKKPQLHWYSFIYYFTQILELVGDQTSNIQQNCFSMTPESLPCLVGHCRIFHTFSIPFRLTFSGDAHSNSRMLYMPQTLPFELANQTSRVFTYHIIGSFGIFRDYKAMHQFNSWVSFSDVINFDKVLTASILIRCILGPNNHSP